MHTLYTGIDVGTYSVKVVIAIDGESKKEPIKVLGQGVSESRGLRHGYVINNTEAVKSIKNAVSQAEKMAGVTIENAHVSIGGVGLNSIVSTGSTIINNEGDEILADDIDDSLAAAEQTIPRASIINRRVLQAIPIEYRVDGKKVHGNPVGLKGARLETKGLFITCLENHISDLIETIEEAGVEVTDISPAPIAASYVTLTKSQRIAGCVLANFGAETVSVIVFEDDKPYSLEVFPIGSTDITNDIALGFKVSLEEAEKMKQDERPKLTDAQKELEELIKNRTIKILELIEGHLKRINRNELLPAGIVLTGGGSGIGNVDDIARSVLSLPSRRAQLLLHRNQTVDVKTQIRDATWAVAIGLCLIARSSGAGRHSSGGLRALFQSLPDTIMGGIQSVSDFIKKFLP